MLHQTFEGKSFMQIFTSTPHCFHTAFGNKVAVTAESRRLKERDDQGKRCERRCGDEVRSSWCFWLTCCRSQRCVPSAVSVNKPPDAAQRCDYRTWDMVEGCLSSYMLIWARTDWTLLLWAVMNIDLCVWRCKPVCVRVCVWSVYKWLWAVCMFFFSILRGPLPLFPSAVAQFLGRDH